MTGGEITLSWLHVFSLSFVVYSSSSLVLVSSISFWPFHFLCSLVNITGIDFEGFQRCHVYHNRRGNTAEPGTITYEREVTSLTQARGSHVTAHLMRMWRCLTCLPEPVLQDGSLIHGGVSIHSITLSTKSQLVCIKKNVSSLVSSSVCVNNISRQRPNMYERSNVGAILHKKNKDIWFLNNWCEHVACKNTANSVHWWVFMLATRIRVTLKKYILR